MVLDTSAILAILLSEPEMEAFVHRIDEERALYLSAVGFVEASIVLRNRKGVAGVEKLDRFLRRSAVEIVAVDRHQAEIARKAYEKFGKGRHPAGLNLGDCFSYALAKSAKDVLLFKGNNFAQTDVQSAMDV